MSASTETPTPPRAPRAIRTTNVVDAGGGPIGSIAATMLQARGIQVTLIEREPDFLQFNSTNAYAIGLHPRAFNLLARIPGMLEHIAPFHHSMDNMRVLGSDGSINSRPMTMRAAGLVQYFMRFRATQLFKEFVVKYTDVKTMYGSYITSVQYHSSGEIDVVVETRNENGSTDTQTLRTRLLLACDGRNSTVARSLLGADGKSDVPNVKSQNGFALWERVSPATGMYIKSIILNMGELEKYGVTSDSFKGSMTIVACPPSVEEIRCKVRLGIFPTCEEDIRHMGGPLPVIIGIPQHELFAIDDVDEAYDLVQLRFPQVDAHRLVTQKQLSLFVKVRVRPFPTVGRRKSLAAYVGEGSRQRDGGGGVVLLGDAAHSFPPDAGQGVNSGFNDVASFLEKLDAAADDASIGDVLRAFENEHDKDTWALMTVAAETVPYQYGQSPWRTKMEYCKIIARHKISECFPQWFHPSICDMLVTTLPYREMVRRDNVTVRRLRGCAGTFGILAGCLGAGRRLLSDMK